MSDPPKVLHRVIRRLASWAVWSFFTEVHVIGGENVPKHGPIIVSVFMDLYELLMNASRILVVPRRITI